MAGPTCTAYVYSSGVSPKLRLWHPLLNQPAEPTTLSPAMISEVQPTINILLPVELLAKIFLDGNIGTDERRTKDFSPSWSRVVSQVCRLWREISLSIPALWRELPALTLCDNGADITARPRPELLELFLERSQTSDIDIIVAGSSLRPHPALELLLEHSHRWGHAKFDLSIFQPDIFARLEGRLLLLSILQLQYTIAQNSIRGPCDGFTVAPNLQVVDLSSKDTVHWLPLPYQQIRSLSISSPSISTLNRFLNCLNKSTMLQRLCLNTRLHSPFIGSIDLPALIHMQLEVYCHGDQLNILNSIRVPALERLVVVGFLQLDCVYDMLLNSQKSMEISLPLEELYLDTHLPDPTSDPSLIVKILQLAKSLKSLEIPVHPDLKIEEVMTALSAKDDTPSFVCSPQLSALKIHFSSDLQVSVEVLRALNDLAESRCEINDGHAMASNLSLLSVSSENSDLAILASSRLHCWSNESESDCLDFMRVSEGSYWMSLRGGILVYVPKHETLPFDSLGRKYHDLNVHYDIGIYITEY